MNTHTNSTLLTQLGSITTAQPWEQNEKQVLTVFLQTVAKAQVPDAGQLATLQAVGEQCPRTGGPAAVFLAAMLYEGFTGERLTQDECGAAARSNEHSLLKAQIMQEQFAVSAYPNPAREQLILDISGGLPPYTIQLVDILGRPSVQQVHTEGQHSIAIGQLAAGMYRLSVSDAKGTQRVQAILVNH